VTKIIAVDVAVYNKLIDRPDLLTVPEGQIPKADGYRPSTPRTKERTEIKAKTPIKEDEEINVTDTPEKQPKQEKSDEQAVEKELEVKTEIKEEPEVKEEKIEVDEKQEKDKTEEAKQEEKMETNEGEKSNVEVKEEKPEESDNKGTGSSQVKEVKENEVKEEKPEETKSEIKPEQKTTEAKPETPKEGRHILIYIVSYKTNTQFLGGSSSGHRLLVFRPVGEFDEIDISKALTMPGRLAYPKVAKPSKLDEFLQRRLQLKAVEERSLTLNAEVKLQLNSLFVESNLLTSFLEQTFSCETLCAYSSTIGQFSFNLQA